MFKLQNLRLKLLLLLRFLLLVLYLFIKWVIVLSQNELVLIIIGKTNLILAIAMRVVF